MHADKHQSFLKVDFNTLSIKVFYKAILSLLMGLKVFKVTSLQSLYKISKNKLGMEVIFLHADKRQSFYQLALSFLMEVARHVQST